MAEYPSTTEEFERRFSSEAACVEYLSRIRWPKGFVCVRCGGDKAWLTGRGLYRCGVCDTQTSVTAGTMFQGTRKGLLAWFRAIWNVTTRPEGASALEIQRLLGLGSYRTAWTWMHKLRRAMVPVEKNLLAGSVVVDQAYLSGEKPQQGAPLDPDRPLIFVAAQEIRGRIGRIVLSRVSERTAKSLQGMIRKNVALDAIVLTDDSSAYQGLRLYGYRHKPVQFGLSGVRMGPLPIVARVIGQLHDWLVFTPHGAVRQSHLDYYLDEFTFRFNNKRLRSPGKLFLRLLTQAAGGDPIMGDEIVGGSADA
ncbi:MAG: IS1595 family transposase [Phycisphaerae bacterium]|jgi:transposase-like protein|nr:IS1595 family transposase [Phycisphaerae bacterium]MDP7286465.1 IS1595 family transposase [Phycisphaerae bacterium]